MGPRIKSVFPESQATRNTQALQIERQKLREKRKGIDWHVTGTTTFARYA